MTPDQITALQQGTLIQVRYHNWVTDPTGDTTRADVSVGSMFCLFWEVKTSTKLGIPILVVTGSQDPDGPREQGFTAWPMSLVADIEVIRRPKKPRAKRHLTEAK